MEEENKRAGREKVGVDRNGRPIYLGDTIKSLHSEISCGGRGTVLAGGELGASERVIYLGASERVIYIDLEDRKFSIRQKKNQRTLIVHNIVGVSTSKYGLWIFESSCDALTAPLNPTHEAADYYAAVTAIGGRP